MDDDNNSQALPHSWKGLIRGFVLLLIVAVASGLAMMSLLKSRPVDLREKTKSAAEAVDKLLADNEFAANRMQRTDEGEKIDDKAIWHAFRYRLDLPVDKTPEDVRLLLAKGLASLGVAVEVEPEGKGLRLLLGCPFAQIELVPVTAEVPVAPAVAPLPEPPSVLPEGMPAPMTPVAPEAMTPILPEAITPVVPEPSPVPVAPPPAAAEPAAPTEPKEGYSPLTPSKPAPVQIEMPVAQPEQTATMPTPVAQPEQTATTPTLAPSGAARPKIAVIVDDGGYGGEVGNTILAMNPALTLSILPYTPRGAELVQKAVAHGFEVMLHMPMEAEEGGKKSAGTLSVAMTPEKIRALTEAALKKVPGAVGVNNHEGSKFTGDAKAMTSFLETVKAHSLFFIDSRTSPLTLAASTAQAMGIRAASRDVFLDNDPAEANIRLQFAELLTLARKNGSAIGICHFRVPTARVLGELLKGLGEREGVDLVHVSQVLP